ncbi:hypothetical protein SNEBB_002487 [Seison nebaliae]|nr:hypothetical protein SNEBB_002487 [Seison nebaliae]
MKVIDNLILQLVTVQSRIGGNESEEEKQSVTLNDIHRIFQEELENDVNYYSNFNLSKEEIGIVMKRLVMSGKLKEIEQNSTMEKSYEIIDEVWLESLCDCEMLNWEQLSEKDMEILTMIAHTRYDGLYQEEILDKLGDMGVKDQALPHLLAKLHQNRLILRAKVRNLTNAYETKCYLTSFFNLRRILAVQFDLVDEKFRRNLLQISEKLNDDDDVIEETDEEYEEISSKSYDETDLLKLNENENYLKWKIDERKIMNIENELIERIRLPHELGHNQLIINNQIKLLERKYSDSDNNDFTCELKLKTIQRLIKVSSTLKRKTITLSEFREMFLDVSKLKYWSNNILRYFLEQNILVRSRKIRSKMEVSENLNYNFGHISIGKELIDEEEEFEMNLDNLKLLRIFPFVDVDGAFVGAKSDTSSFEMLVEMIKFLRRFHVKFSQTSLNVASSLKSYRKYFHQCSCYVMNREFVENFSQLQCDMSYEFGECPKSKIFLFTEKSDEIFFWVRKKFISDNHKQLTTRTNTNNRRMTIKEMGERRKKLIMEIVDGESSKGSSIPVTILRNRLEELERNRFKVTTSVCRKSVSRLLLQMEETIEVRQHINHGLVYKVAVLKKYNLPKDAPLTRNGPTSSTSDLNFTNEFVEKRSTKKSKPTGKLLSDKCELITPKGLKANVDYLLKEIYEEDEENFKRRNEAINYVLFCRQNILVLKKMFSLFPANNNSLNCFISHAIILHYCLIDLFENENDLPIYNTTNEKGMIRFIDLIMRMKVKDLILFNPYEKLGEFDREKRLMDCEREMMKRILPPEFFWKLQHTFIFNALIILERLTLINFVERYRTDQSQMRYLTLVLRLRNEVTIFDDRQSEKTRGELPKLFYNFSRRKDAIDFWHDVFLITLHHLSNGQTSNILPIKTDLQFWLPFDQPVHHHKYLTNETYEMFWKQFSNNLSEISLTQLMRWSERNLRGKVVAKNVICDQKKFENNNQKKTSVKLSIKMTKEEEEKEEEEEEKKKNKKKKEEEEMEKERKKRKKENNSSFKRRKLNDENGEDEINNLFFIFNHSYQLLMMLVIIMIYDYLPQSLREDLYKFFLLNSTVKTNENLLKKKFGEDEKEKEEEIPERNLRKKRKINPKYCDTDYVLSTTVGDEDESFDDIDEDKKILNKLYKNYERMFLTIRNDLLNEKFISEIDIETIRRYSSIINEDDNDRMKLVKFLKNSINYFVEMNRFHIDIDQLEKSIKFDLSFHSSDEQIHPPLFKERCERRFTNSDEIQIYLDSELFISKANDRNRIFFQNNSIFLFYRFLFQSNGCCLLNNCFFNKYRDLIKLIVMNSDKRNWKGEQTNNNRIHFDLNKKKLKLLVDNIPGHLASLPQDDLIEDNFLIKNNLRRYDRINSYQLSTISLKSFTEFRYGDMMIEGLVNFKRMFQLRQIDWSHSSIYHWDFCKYIEHFFCSGNEEVVNSSFFDGSEVFIGNFYFMLRLWLNNEINLLIRSCSRLHTTHSPQFNKWEYLKELKFYCERALRLRECLNHSMNDSQSLDMEEETNNNEKIKDDDDDNDDSDEKEDNDNHDDDDDDEEERPLLLHDMAHYNSSFRSTIAPLGLFDLIDDEHPNEKKSKKNVELKKVKVKRKKVKFDFSSYEDDYKRMLKEVQSDHKKKILSKRSLNESSGIDERMFDEFHSNEFLLNVDVEEEIISIKKQSEKKRKDEELKKSEKKRKEKKLKKLGKKRKVENLGKKRRNEKLEKSTTIDQISEIDNLLMESIERSIDNVNELRDEKKRNELEDISRIEMTKKDEKEDDGNLKIDDLQMVKMNFDEITRSDNDGLILQVDQLDGKSSSMSNNLSVYRCSFCNLRSVNRTSFKRHMKMHEKDRMIECRICGAYTMTNDDEMDYYRLLFHYSLFHVRNGIPNRLLDETLNKSSNLMEFIQINFKDRLKLSYQKCLICWKMIPNDLIYQHMLDDHQFSLDDDNLFDDKQWKCTSCFGIQFPSFSSLVHHQFAHFNAVRINHHPCDSFEINISVLIRLMGLIDECIDENESPLQFHQILQKGNKRKINSSFDNDNLSENQFVTTSMDGHLKDIFYQNTISSEDTSNSPEDNSNRKKRKIDDDLLSCVDLENTLNLFLDSNRIDELIEMSKNDEYYRRLDEFSKMKLNLFEKNNRKLSIIPEMELNEFSNFLSNAISFISCDDLDKSIYNKKKINFHHIINDYDDEKVYFNSAFSHSDDCDYERIEINDEDLEKELFHYLITEKGNEELIENPKIEMNQENDSLFHEFLQSIDIDEKMNERRDQMMENEKNVNEELEKDDNEIIRFVPFNFHEREKKRRMSNLILLDLVKRKRFIELWQTCQKLRSKRYILELIYPLHQYYKYSKSITCRRHRRLLLTRERDRIKKNRHLNITVRYPLTYHLSYNTTKNRWDNWDHFLKNWYEKSGLLKDDCGENEFLLEQPTPKSSLRQFDDLFSEIIFIVFSEFAQSDENVENIIKEFKRWKSEGQEVDSLLDNYECDRHLILLLIHFLNNLNQFNQMTSHLIELIDQHKHFGVDFSSLHRHLHKNDEKWKMLVECSPKRKNEWNGHKFNEDEYSVFALRTSLALLRRKEKFSILSFFRAVVLPIL